MAEEVKKQEMVPVDLNDLSLDTEPLGDDFKPGEDAFQMPPPPDDGLHRVKLGYGQDKWKQGVSKTGKKFLMAHLQLTPVDEKGWAVFDRPSTMVLNSGTSRAAGIILAVTGQPAQARDIAGVARELDKLVQAERVVKVETLWEASCNHGVEGGKYDTVKRGQTKFRPLRAQANGKPAAYDPQIECPKCHMTVSAQARVVKYVYDGAVAPAQAQAASAAVDVSDNPFGSDGSEGTPV